MSGPLTMIRPDSKPDVLALLAESLTVPERNWRDDAVCAQIDPEAFFPEKGGSTKAARAVCARCPVVDECLEYALDHDERFGVWGGLSERQRRVVAAARRERVAA